MSGYDLPADVVAFVRGHISSIMQLELLLSMRAAGASRRSAAALSAELRSAEAWTAEQLSGLVAAGLLDRDGDSEPVYWYEPRDCERARAVSRVADCFRHRKTRVTT